jgi:hypothetical protein
MSIRAKRAYWVGNREMGDLIYIALIFGGFGLCWLGIMICQRL